MSNVATQTSVHHSASVALAQKTCYMCLNEAGLGDLLIRDEIRYPELPAPVDGTNGGIRTIHYKLKGFIAWVSLVRRNGSEWRVDGVDVVPVPGEGITAYYWRTADEDDGSYTDNDGVHHKSYRLA